MEDLIEKYEESSSFSGQNVERFSKGRYIVEKVGDSLHGELRILRYYPEYEKFGQIICEEMHNELYEALKDINEQQLDRTIRKFESTGMAYFWVYIKDRMGEIWLTEDDRRKIEEIADKLRELS